MKIFLKSKKKLSPGTPKIIFSSSMSFRSFCTLLSSDAISNIPLKHLKIYLSKSVKYMNEKTKTEEFWQSPSLKPKKLRIFRLQKLYPKGV